MGTPRVLGVLEIVRRYIVRRFCLCSRCVCVCEQKPPACRAALLGELHARQGVRELTTRLGGRLRNCDSDVRSTIDGLFEVVRHAQDAGTRLGVLNAMGAAVLGPHGPSVAHTIRILGLAARPGSDVAGDDAVMRQVARMLCHATGAAAAENVDGAIEAIFWAADMHGEGEVTDAIVRELGAAMRWIADGSMETAMSRLLDIAEDGNERDSDLAIAMLFSVLKQATNLRVAGLVGRIMRSAQAWAEVEQERLLFTVESWLIGHSEKALARRIVRALAEEFPALRDAGFSHMLVGSLIHVLEESFTDELQRPTLDALEQIARSSQDEAVHIKIVEAMHMGLWLGTVSSDQVILAMRSLVDIGKRASSSRVKLNVVDALWHHIWERAGAEQWSVKVMQLAATGMAEVARTSDDMTLHEAFVMNCAEMWTKRPITSVKGVVLQALGICTAVDDPRSAAAVVGNVSTVVLRSSQQGNFPRAIEWLVNDIFFRANHAIVKQVVMDAVSSLGTSETIVPTVDILHRMLLDSDSSEQRSILRTVAAHLVDRCSSRAAKRITPRLATFILEDRLSWVKQEVIGWLAAGLKRRAEGLKVLDVFIHTLLDVGLDAPEAYVKARVLEELRAMISARGTSRESRMLAASGLVRIALRSKKPTIQMPVVEMLGDFLVGTDARWARFAVRSLIKLADGAECSDVGHALGKRLAIAVLGRDCESAKLAIDGLMQHASASGDTEFREQTWGIITSACHRPVLPEVRMELEAARDELLRLREATLQEENRKAEAKPFASAA